MTPFPPHHRLLTRQLRKLGIESGVPDAKQWSEFLGMVATTYHEADLERDTLERSLTISSIEMRELYDDLARSSASELATERDKLRGIMAVQTAVLDASPDGIVVMDQAGNVLLANRRFAEVCRIPAEVMATGDQVAIRRAALAQAVDPDKVMLKVDELQPDQTGVASDELEFRDARVIERYSYPAIDAAGLPHVDLVVISHDHYDHLDAASVDTLARQPGNSVFSFVPSSRYSAITSASSPMRSP